jgi:hypothetical protein
MTVPACIHDGAGFMTTRRTILKATFAAGTAAVFSGTLGGLTALA